MTVFIQQIRLEPDSGNYLIYKKMKQWIPERLDIDALLQERPPTFTPYKRDKAVHFLHMISEVASLRDEYTDEFGFVSLSGLLLQLWCKNYPAYVAYFVDNNVIEVDRHYIVGEKTRGYKFTSGYQGLLKEIAITDKTLVKNLERNSEPDAFSVSKYQHLFQFIDNGLKLDHVGAMAYLTQKLLRADPSNAVEYRSAINSYNAGIMSIDRLQNHRLYFKVDDTCHRLHTNITGLKRELRNFLTYEGIPLVAVDISNSQPFMSVVLINNGAFWSTLTNGNRFNYHNTMPDLHATQFFDQVTIDELTTHSSRSNATDVTSTNDDVALFIHHVQLGTLYEFMQQKIHEQRDLQPTTRAQVKESVFKMIYSKNKSPVPYIGVFRDLFPTINNTYTLLKREKNNKLAILLQRIESKFMLDHVVGRIATEHPRMPIYTIHDSLICPVGEEEYVKSMIQSGAMQCFGVVPSVKYEFLRPPG